MKKTYKKEMHISMKEEMLAALSSGTDEEVVPNHTYQMHGNKISVRSLDMDKPFAEIRMQLDDIAKEHFG